MPVIHERGYLIPAVNTPDTDYVDCARRLARSLKQWHPDAIVCLLTDIDQGDNSIFDLVKILPYGDIVKSSKWKLNNDWQVFEGTCFRQTIKLEADMIVASPIDHYWELFQNKDVVIAQGCRDFYDQPSQVRAYRKQFDVNNLPDVYNGIVYWRLSNTAKEFFDLVRDIFENWDSYKTLLKFADEMPTTDIVYAIAAIIVGPENVTLPHGSPPNMVHMKKKIIPTTLDNWKHELVWENTEPGFRLNGVAQWGFVHYHIKDTIKNE